MTGTASRRIVAEDQRAGGFWTLSEGPGEPWQQRQPGDEPSRVPIERSWECLLALAHLSDVHICDHQSPARVEFLDRFAHPDAPTRSSLDDEGRAYRPQEVLTTQVLEAMVQAVNKVDRGPWSGRALDVALLTGDTTDNAQQNELQWLLDVMAGRVVQPDSGDRTRHQGVGDPRWFDPYYWHPEGGQGDIPHLRHGFPDVVGLLAVARSSFAATGLSIPWLAVYGNHDGLLQGTMAVNDGTRAHATGSAKAWTIAEHVDAQAARDLLDGIVDERTLGVLAHASFREVTPDPSRRPLTRSEHVACHVADGGHGFTAQNIRDSTAYYRRDIGPVTVLVLDTVVEHGGWQGSLDAPQAEWLDATLRGTADRYVILASHHTLADLVNDNAPVGAARRVLGAELKSMLRQHRHVIAWLNGHTHTTRVQFHGEPASGFWEITAPSLIDWPQQGRIVELLRDDEDLAIACTMLDHAGPACAPERYAPRTVSDLASLSRELAANSWAAPAGVISPDAHPRAGHSSDRNVVLHLPGRAKR